MLLATVLAILVLDVVLAVVTWAIIELVWNTIARKEFQVRSNLTWARLLGIVVVIADAGVIAHLILVPGESMFWSLASVLLGEAGLVTITWFLIAVAWNTVVREELKVMNNITWAVVLGIVVAIANALAIARLFQLQ